MAEPAESDLTSALELWRRTRDPRVAHVVCAIGRAICPRVRRASTADQRHRAFVEALTRSDDAELDAYLGRMDDTSRARMADERMRAVLARGPDPRSVEAVRRVAGTARYRFDSWWERATEILQTWGPRDLDFRGLAAEMRRSREAAWVVERAGEVEALVSRAPEPLPLSDDEQTWLASWLERYPAPPRETTGAATSQVDALLALVADDPDDDAPRAVLADLLLAAGDPRGTLVAAQLARAASPDQEPRFRIHMLGRHLDGLYPPDEEELVAAHRAEWFGPWFANVLRERVTRGFPEEIWVWEKKTRLPDVIGSPGLATVRVIHRPDPPATGMGRRKPLLAGKPWHRFLQDPALRNVRRIDFVLPSEICVIADGGPPVTDLAVRCQVPGQLGDVGRALTRIPTLERVRLRVTPADLGDLAHVRVPTLELELSEVRDERFYDRHIDPELVRGILAAASPDVRRVEVAYGLQLMLRLVREPGGFTVELGRLPPRDGFAQFHAIGLLAALPEVRRPTALDDPLAGYGIAELHYGRLPILRELPAAPLWIERRRRPPFRFHDDPLPPPRALPLDALGGVPELRLELWHPAELSALDARPDVGHVTLLGAPRGTATVGRDGYAWEVGAREPVDSTYLRRADDGRLREAWVRTDPRARLHTIEGSLHRVIVRHSWWTGRIGLRAPEPPWEVVAAHYRERGIDTDVGGVPPFPTLIDGMATRRAPHRHPTASSGVGSAMGRRGTGVPPEA